MLRAFSTAATGMSAQEMRVNVIANNLANINTNGFKRSQIDFHDLIYVQEKSPGSESGAGTAAPTGLEVGNGVRPASTLKVFSQGELEKTSNPTDLMIEGEGFFKVQDAIGQDRYTRDGSFRIDADGSLVTSSGYRLQPSITIPADYKQITIGRDGRVSVTAGPNGDLQVVGQITLTRFQNPSGLASVGENLFSETPASGTAMDVAPTEAGAGTILQGWLERSNVQMVTELVNLIMAQRAYEINSRAIKAGDEMLNTANRLIQ